jgi:hypothetical protein
MSIDRQRLGKHRLKERVVESEKKGPLLGNGELKHVSAATNTLE